MSVAPRARPAVPAQRWPAALRRWSVRLFPVVFVLAGAAHFVMPDFYVRKLPAWVPARLALVLAAGVYEIAAAVLAGIPRTRAIGSLGIALFLSCVLPVNLYYLIGGAAPEPVPVVVLWARLAFIATLATWAFVNARFGSSSTS